MNTEKVNHGMVVSVLVMKSLERAAREYARECVLACGSRYNFDAEEALKELNLENVGIQVNAMKKRGSNKAGKVVKEVKMKEVKMKEVKEKAVKEKRHPLPFAASGVNESGCRGLAYNGGLFTQCEKARLESGRYCHVCQKESDGSASGKPSNGTVEERLSCGLMEYRDGKGRKPVAYMKIMERDGLERVAVEEEAGKRNITLDEIHFAVVDEKKTVSGRPKALKRNVTVESVSVEDLFAQLVDDDSEDDSESETVLASDIEEIADSREQEKMERCEMKDADNESKKAEKEHKQVINKAAKEEKMAADKVAKEEKMAADKVAKEEKIAADKAAKEEKIAADKVAKEEKIAADKVAKEEKIAADKVAKEEKIAADKVAKEEKIAADKAAKEQKIIDDLAAKVAKEEKIAADKVAKEQKIAADKVAKEQKIVDDLEAKVAKEEKMAADKVAKEEKIAADKVAKEEKIAADKVAKEQKIINDLAAKVAKEEKMAADKVAKEEKMAKAKEAKMAADKVAKESKKELGEKVAKAKESGEKVAKAKESGEKESGEKKKVTVKRITINGKQYLKTCENLLYDPETKEEMGIYDSETNTIKELPDDSEDEVSEDGYESE